MNNPGLNIILTEIAGRWRAGWRDALAASVAAGLAWVVALSINQGHQPVFASIAALVCLAPGLPSHGRQAVGVLLGVSTGIMIGEAALLFPEFSLPLRIGFLTLLSMMAGVSFGFGAVLPIQAGVSALLVVLLDLPGAGATRLLDMLVGAGMGLLFSQVLLTPNPICLIDLAARQLVRRLAASFDRSAEALTSLDQAKAQDALMQVSAAHNNLVALQAGIAKARSSVRWSVRGRLAAREITAMAARYDRRAIRLYASALLFSEALAGGLRKEAPPSYLKDRVVATANACRALLGEAGARAVATPASEDAPVSPAWHYCLAQLGEVESAIAAFQRTDIIQA